MQPRPHPHRSGARTVTASGVLIGSVVALLACDAGPDAASDPPPGDHASQPGLRSAPLSPDDLTPSAPFPRDVEVKVTQGFDGTTSHYFRQTRNGVDFVVNPSGHAGMSVVAVADGTVESVVSGLNCNTWMCGEGACNHGFGNAVVIRHGDGLYSLYAHLQAAVPVIPGQVVSRGTVLGALGNSGYTSGPHLHFQFQSTATTHVSGDPGVTLAFDRFDASACIVADCVWPSTTATPASTCVDSCGAAATACDGRIAAGNSTLADAFRWAWARTACRGRSIGCPPAGTSGLVHEVGNDVLLQDFVEPRSECQLPGSAADSALVASRDFEFCGDNGPCAGCVACDAYPDGSGGSKLDVCGPMLDEPSQRAAYLLRGGFWGAYKCLGGRAVPAGHLPAAYLLGAPSSDELICTGDEAVACNPGVTRQYFQHGYMDFGCSDPRTSTCGSVGAASAAEPDGCAGDQRAAVFVHSYGPISELEDAVTAANERCPSLAILCNPPIADGPEVAPSLGIDGSPTSVSPGSSLTLHLQGLSFNAPFDVLLHPSTGPARAVVSGTTSEGTAIVPWTVPLDLTAGPASLVARDRRTGRTSPPYDLFVTSGAALVRVAPQPAPDVRATCLDQGGTGFPPDIEVTLVFADPVAGIVSRDNGVRTDASGAFAWSFGLGPGCDPAARTRAEAWLARVDPLGLGVSARPARYHAEYWSAGLQRTPAVDYTLSATATCSAECGARVCGEDACGRACGTCTGTQACSPEGTCVASGAYGLTVSGTLVGDTTWTASQSPVLVNGDLTVTGSLTIEPGVVVAFDDDRHSLTVTGGGRLTAVGTAAQPIAFTSASGTTPQSWGGIIIGGSAGAVHLSRVELRHGGDSDEGGAPIFLNPRVPTPPVLDRLRFRGNRVNGIGLSDGALGADAYIPAAGDAAYWIDDLVTVSPGTTLRIAAGAVLKFADYTAGIRVEGRLVTEGTPAAPVVLTAGRDDARLGDTDAAGGSACVASDWAGVYIGANGAQPESTLSDTVIACGGSNVGNSVVKYALHLSPFANPVLTNVTFDRNRRNGVALETGALGADARLDLVGYPYWLGGDLTVNANTTLTLEPGVVLKFGADDTDLHVMGRLVANGVPERPIIFTGGADDPAGGDTNGDGSSVCGPASWGGIKIFDNGSQAESDLAHARISCAGYPWGNSNGYAFPLVLEPYANPTLSDVRIEGNRRNGVTLVAGTWVRDVRLNLVGYPYLITADVVVAANTTLTIDPGVVIKFAEDHHDLLVSGRVMGLGTPSQPIVLTGSADDARGGDTDGGGGSACGPRQWGGVYLRDNGAQADSELRHVIIACNAYPWSNGNGIPYPILLDPYTNPSLVDVRFDRTRTKAVALVTGTWSRDVHLDLVGLPYWIDDDVTVAAGTTLRIDPGVIVKLVGEQDDLSIQGALSAIGTAEAPIVFTGAADDAHGGDSDAGGAGACAAQAWGGIYLGDNGAQSDSELAHVRIACAGQTYTNGAALRYPLVVHPYTNPRVLDLSLERNRVAGIGLVAGTWTQDVELEPLGFPFWLESDTTVAAGTTLTIDPGVVLRFDSESDDLVIHGALSAVGTPAAPICLTSGRDATPCGPGGTLSGGGWGGVYVTNTATSVVLSHAVLRDAGDAAGSTGFALAVANRAARIEHTRFELNDDLISIMAGGLADLGGGALASAGGNELRGPTPNDGNWAVYNESVDDIPARGNLWNGYTTAAQIEGVLRDSSDGFAVGKVVWNSVPSALALTVEGVEDTPLSLTLTGTDPDGGALSFEVVGSPAHGTLTGAAPSLTYRPHVDYHGSDRFAFRVTDGLSWSTPSDVTIAIAPRNDAPMATARGWTTAEDTALAITLEGSDVDGDALTFEVTTQPAHGSLSSNADGLVYLPVRDYVGADAFQFVARDASATSQPATVTIEVQPVQDPPVAFDFAATTAEDAVLVMELPGDDPDGDALSWEIDGPPEHGTASVSGRTLRYTPALDFHGGDSVRYVVRDAERRSASATVSLTVTPRNDVPVAHGQTVLVPEDGEATFELVASDVDGDALALAVDLAPAFGSLSGEPPTLTYRPHPDFAGADELSFRATDPTGESGTAIVRIVVEPADDAPIAQAASATTPEDVPLVISLRAHDPDGDPLTFELVSEPAHGSVVLASDEVTFGPDADYHGPDGFLFRVSDGRTWSATAEVSISIEPLNDPPRLAGLASGGVLRWELREDEPAKLSLEVSDVEGDAVSVAVGDPPAEGELVVEGLELTYTPSPDRHGEMTAGLILSDAQASASVPLVLAISAVNDVPQATGAAVATLEDVPLAIVLGGVDVDGDGLSFAVVEGPQHGALTGSGAARWYAPDADYHGMDAITFTASDGVATSPPAVVSIVVAPAPDQPVADAGPAQEVAERTLVTLDGRGSRDVDGDALGYRWVQIAGQVVSLNDSHTSVPWFEAPRVQQGTVTLGFRLVVDDGSLESAPADTQVIVASAQPNRAPLARIVGPVEASAGERVTLDGSESSDPDGDPLRWHWSQDLGPPVDLGPADGDRVTFTIPVDGGAEDIVVSLIVSDGLANSAPAVHQVVISGGAADPEPGPEDPPESEPAVESETSVDEQVEVTEPGEAAIEEVEAATEEMEAAVETMEPQPERESDAAQEDPTPDAEIETAGSGREDGCAGGGGHLALAMLLIVVFRSRSRPARGG